MGGEGADGVVIDGFIIDRVEYRARYDHGGFVSEEAVFPTMEALADDMIDRGDPPTEVQSVTIYKRVVRQ